MSRRLPALLMLGFVLDGLRLRRRLGRLAALEPAAEPAMPRHRFASAAGVELDAGTRRAAGAFAVREGLDVVDLIPRDLPVDRALDVARTVDTARFRSDRLAAGRGALQALLVDPGVLDRAGAGRLDCLTPVELADLTARLKRCASASTDLVVAPDLRAGPDELDKRLALARATHGVAGWYSPVSVLVLARPALAYAALVAGAFANPAWGAAAAVLWCAQPYLVFAGRVPLAPRDLHRAALLRPVRDPLRWARTVAGRWRPPTPADPYEQHRPGYAEELAAGTGRFFEPLRDTCPWCGSAGLAERLTSGELIQGKPGRFTLEQCEACGHIFQNPRLSPAGLDFYYRDFYDGLGAEASEARFVTLGRLYRERAEMLVPFTTPGAWLDVGAGHGHFCNVARDTWPGTAFDGLDVSSSIEAAERRRWIDHGYRGHFPDLAGELAGRYDVVSMHHYLEHTREPLAELDAAAAVLTPGGYLMIELPNPESRFGRLLGSHWMPWFQPQHQHLVPLRNLLAALTERGFSPVAVARGRAHLPADLTWAAALALNALAPHPRRPWLAGEPTRRRRLRFAAVWTAGIPLLVGTRVLDTLLGAVVSRTRGGNAYRVLARSDV